MTVDKTNDANGNGTFSKTEQAAVAGQSVPFQVVVTNNSAVPIVIDSITDAYGTTSTPECTTLDGTLAGTIPAGGSVTCSFTIAGYAPAAGGSLTDTVTVLAHELNNPANTVSGQSSSTVTTAATPPVVVPPTLSLTVVKTNDANGDHTFTDTEAAGAANQAVPFLVAITNNSPVSVVLTSITDSFGATVANECPGLLNTALAPGASTTCTFTIAGYSPAAGSSLIDTVQVLASQLTNPSNTTSGSDTSTVLTPQAPTPGAPDLSVVKAANRASVTAGQLLTYTLTVTNVGSGPTTGAVTVTDAVPAGLNLLSVGGGADWSCGAAGANVTCTYLGAALAPGATAAPIVVLTRVLGSAPTVLVNTGIVHTPGDTNPTNDTSTVQTPVVKVLPFKITKPPAKTPTATPVTKPASSPTVLPFTGSGVMAGLPYAMELMVAGALLLVTGRRRRRYSARHAG